jgi:3-oxoacyl-[acyl-carrier-protein] synthase-1
MAASITAIGVVSALGLDWETSCAAFRCGISRAGKLDHFRIQADDPWEVEFAVGHQVDLLTRGFEGHGRLLRLLKGALSDLIPRVPVALRDSGSTPAYLCLPNPHRTLSNIELIVDEEIRDETRARSVDRPPTEVSDAAEALLFHAAALAKWPGTVRLAGVSHAGYTGMIEMIDRCLSDMQAGRTVHAIVGTVDSLLDDETLAWLSSTRRLKNPAIATGMIPGEAGVVLLLSERQANADGMGIVESLAFDEEDQPFETRQSALGKGLSGVIRQVASTTGWPGQDPPWVLSDQNGETYRASDWGWALHRLTAADPVFAATRVWFPAVSFGDTGGAGAGLGVACALSAWRRGYAPSSRCCVVASSDCARRAAMLLSCSNPNEVRRHG